MNTARTTALEKPRIIDLDKQTKTKLSKTDHFVIQADWKHREHGKDIFCVVLGSTLSEHSDFAEKILQGIRKPRILFVKLDTNVNSILDKLSCKPWRQLQSVLIFEQWDQVDRVLHAWCDHAQEERVALAWVEGNSLLVKSCSLKPYEIEFSKLKSLAHIKANDRDKFTIDEFGRHLYWPDYDLHIDIIDAIRYQTDEKYRNNRDIQDIVRNSNYGAAVAALRDKCNLTQKHIEQKTGLTDRQLRRIEREGHSITLEVAEKLSCAHNMKLQEYLQAVAGVLFELHKSRR